MKIFKVLKIISLAIKHYFFKKQLKTVAKPKTMVDVPDSASSGNSDDQNDTYKGLSQASMHLGEGAVLYLQTMKTLAIMFFILTAINLPLYFVYS